MLINGLDIRISNHLKKTKLRRIKRNKWWKIYLHWIGLLFGMKGIRLVLKNEKESRRQFRTIQLPVAHTLGTSRVICNQLYYDQLIKAIERYDKLNDGPPNLFFHRQSPNIDPNNLRYWKFY